MANVTIYTTPTCAFCKMAKDYFQEKGVEFTEKDVATDEEARNQSVEKSGQTGVPVIDVDGEIVVGFNQEKLNELLGLE